VIICLVARVAPEKQIILLPATKTQRIVTKGYVMLIELTAVRLATMGAEIAKRNGIRVKVPRGGGGAAVKVSKKIYKTINDTNRTKHIKPKNMSGNGFWQGYLLNYIQNNGRIIAPVKQLFVSTHPTIEVPDWLANCINAPAIKKTYVKHKKETNNGYTREKAQALYNSDEWRALRYEVLKEQNGCCQLCGRSRKDGVVLHVDHIIPLSVDWSKRFDKNNLQVLCADCNLGKSNKDTIDWR